MTLDNNQISGRQCRRSLLTELFGISVFLMTASLITIYGRNCFQMLILGGLVTLLLGLYYWYLGHDKTKAYGKQVAEAFPHMGKGISILYVLRFTFRAGFILSIFYQLLDQYLLKEAGFSYIVVPIILLSGYGAMKGREKRLRTMEMLMWFVFVPFLLAILCLVKDIDITHFTEAVTVTADSNKLGQGFLIPVALFSNIEFVLFLLPKIRQEDRGIKNMLWPVLMALSSNLLLMFTAVGVLGYSNCIRMEQPVIRMLQSISVPGAFIRRLDILVLAFWIFAIFGVVSGCIFYSGRIIRDNWTYLKSRTYYPWELLIVMVLVYIMSFACFQFSDAFIVYFYYSIYIDIPLGMLLAFIVSKKSFGKKTKMTALFMACVLSVTMVSGCGKMKDVEDWDYVLTLGIDKGCYSFGLATADEATAESVEAENLEQAVKKYEATHPNTLQFGHLVAVILGEEVVKETNETYRVLLKELEKRNEIPINTSVYGIYGTAKDALLNGPYENKTLGEYLDQLYGNNREEEGKELALKNMAEAIWKGESYEMAMVTVKEKKVQEITRYRIKCGL